MISQTTIDSIRRKYNALKMELDERSRRLWAATEANSLGHGGVAAVRRATGMAESTIRRGRVDLDQVFAIEEKGSRRVRKKGGGRKSLTAKNGQLLKALDCLVAPTTRGDLQSSLRWTCKSARRLAEELCQAGFST